mgnify:CR=1 FL=1
MLIKKCFKFDAAHNLISYHGKCEELHGHTYRLVVSVIGDPGEEGMVIDFTELKKIVGDKVISVLDHSYINNIIEQPTAENIALWIWKNIENDLHSHDCTLAEIEVWETETSCAVLRAEDIR